MSVDFARYNGSLVQASDSFLSIQKTIEEWHLEPREKVGIDSLKRSYLDLTHQTERLLSDLPLLQQEEEFKSGLHKKILRLQNLVSSLEGRIQELSLKNPEPLRSAWLRAHNAASAIKRERESFAALYSSLQIKMEQKSTQEQPKESDRSLCQKANKERQESLKIQNQRLGRLLQQREIMKETYRWEELEQEYAANNEKILQIDGIVAQEDTSETNKVGCQKKKMEKMTLLKTILDFHAHREVTSLQALMNVYADSIIALTGEAPMPRGVEESIVSTSDMGPWERVEQDLDAIENIYSPHVRSKALYDLFSVAGLPIQERQKFYQELQLKSLLGKGVPQARYAYFHGADHMVVVRALIRERITSSNVSRIN